MLRVPLQDLVERHPGVARAVPPRPERQVLGIGAGIRGDDDGVLCLHLEPLFEGQPPKGVYNQLPLPEVSGLKEGN